MTVLAAPVVIAPSVAMPAVFGKAAMIVTALAEMPAVVAVVAAMLLVVLAVVLAVAAAMSAVGERRRAEQRKPKRRRRDRGDGSKFHEVCLSE